MFKVLLCKSIFTQTVAEKFKAKALMNLLTINHIPLVYEMNGLRIEDWFCKYYLLLFLHKNLLETSCSKFTVEVISTEVCGD